MFEFFFGFPDSRGKPRTGEPIKKSKPGITLAENNSGLGLFRDFPNEKASLENSKRSREPNTRFSEMGKQWW